MRMRAVAVLAAGTWNALRAADSVLLDHDHRHRRRITLRTEAGADLLLDLPQAARLRDGDGLALEGGGVVRVRAKPEPLLEIRTSDETTLLRIAWHLGNRHLPVQVSDKRLRIGTDHVIADLVVQLGGTVEEIEAPFDPEAGAYAGGHRHDDDHDHHG
jgi:urease accessory protein